jgi:hypothetical protein
MNKSGLSSLILLGCAFSVSVAGQVTPPKIALPQIEVGTPRGYFDAPFSLTLKAPAEGGVIRYTIDGSEPTAANGSEYRGPLPITNTTVLRAAAFKEKSRFSKVTTHTYLFLDQVSRQPKDPPGFPAGPRAWNGHPAVYGMDPRVVNDPLYDGKMKDALRSLPVLSVACSRDHIFGARSGIYVNSMENGEAWERPCSVELILPDGATGFQIDCGIRIQGNQNRVPEKSPKHAFRLLFKEKYGPGKLHYPIFPDSAVDKFDTLVLRADYNNSWIHWDANARPRAQRTRDAWLKDSHRAMGWVASHNRYLHLFIDGLYWGIYDATERPDASFAASYWGGTKEDYDVINEFQAKNGTLDVFNLLQRSMGGLSSNAAYEKLQQYLNVTEYIDYLLLNYYAGNQDWGERKNWYAIRPRVPSGTFQYLIWDGEQILHDVNDNTITHPFEMPFRLAQSLMTNPEYRLAFADRAQKHLFNDGALTPKAAADRWLKRAKEVDLAMIAESARWGYYRRRTPFTRNDDWMAEQRRLLTAYFPRRTQIVIDQLRAVGLYPSIAAPVFNQRGGKVGEGYRLQISAYKGATVCYTTNGTDPRFHATGVRSPGALVYTNGIVLNPPVTIKARVLKDQTWSALNEAAFDR